jgi:hypothetical protein
LQIAANVTIPNEDAMQQGSSAVSRPKSHLQARFAAGSLQTLADFADIASARVGAVQQTRGAVVRPAGMRSEPNGRL